MAAQLLAITAHEGYPPPPYVPEEPPNSAGRATTKAGLPGRRRTCSCCDDDHTGWTSSLVSMHAGGKNLANTEFKKQREKKEVPTDTVTLRKEIQSNGYYYSRRA